MITVEQLVEAIQVWQDTNGIPPAVRRYNRLIETFATEQDITVRDANRVALAAYERSR